MRLARQDHTTGTRVIVPSFLVFECVEACDCILSCESVIAGSNLGDLTYDSETQN